MFQRASRPAQPSSKFPVSSCSRAKFQVDLGIVRIERADMRIGRKGFIEPLQLTEAYRPIGERLHAIRLQPERLIEPWQGLLFMTLRAQDRADSVADFGIARIELDGRADCRPAPPQAA